MAAKFKPGDTVYILESNRIVRESTIVSCSGGMYLLRFENGGGIKVKEHRLFATAEEAESKIIKAPKPKYRIPYDYGH